MNAIGHEVKNFIGMRQQDLRSALSRAGDAVAKHPRYMRQVVGVDPNRRRKQRLKYDTSLKPQA